MNNACCLPAPALDFGLPYRITESPTEQSRVYTISCRGSGMGDTAPRRVKGRKEQRRHSLPTASLSDWLDATLRDTLAPQVQRLTYRGPAAAGAKHKSSQLSALAHRWSGLDDLGDCNLRTAFVIPSDIPSKLNRDLVAPATFLWAKRSWGCRYKVSAC